MTDYINEPAPNILHVYILLFIIIIFFTLIRLKSTDRCVCVWGGGGIFISEQSVLKVGNRTNEINCLIKQTGNLLVRRASIIYLCC